MNIHSNFLEQQLHILEEVEIADEKMLLSLCASSVVAVIMKRRQKRRKNRKIWTREWLRNRTIFVVPSFAAISTRALSLMYGFCDPSILYRTGTEKSRTD